MHPLFFQEFCFTFKKYIFLNGAFKIGTLKKMMQGKTGQNAEVMMIKGWVFKIYDRRLKELCMFSVDTPGDKMVVFKYLKDCHKKDGGKKGGFSCHRKQDKKEYM